MAKPKKSSKPAAAMAKDGKNPKEKSFQDSKKSKEKSFQDSKKSKEKSQDLGNGMGKSDADKAKSRETFLNNRKMVTSFTNWTGKLPATLLHEHCQKQKWEKVQYDMRKLGTKGFIGTAILSWKNPQDQQLVTIQYKLPYVDLDHPEANIINPVETTMEARHLIATYTLHRICFEKNLQLMLPPDHKKIWSSLEQERKKYLKLNPDNYKNIYNANPFQNHLQNELEKKKKQKQLEAEKQQQAKTAKKKTEIVIEPKVNGSYFGTKFDSNDKPANTLSKKLANLNMSSYKFPRKAWEQAPLVDLDSSSRLLIEETLKHHIDWTDQPIKKAGSDTTKDSDIVAVLSNLGFRHSHIEEALLYTETLTQALEWLIFHLPEDDLPEFFAKQQRDSKINVKVAADIKVENILRELENSGYAKSSIVQEFKNKDFDLSTVAHKVAIGTLLNESEKQLVHNLVVANNTPDHAEVSKEDWINEIDGLMAVYPKKVVVDTDDYSCVLIHLAPEKMGQKDLISLKCHFHPFYPFTLVGLQLCIKENYKLANYIKIAILKQVASHVVNSRLGDCYLLDMIEFLEENIAAIYKNPGPLFDASSKVQKQLEAAARTPKETKKKKNASHRRNVDEKSVEKSYRQRTNDPKYQGQLRNRAQLPAFGKKDKIVEIINSNKVTLVTGETGSGKSTQVVQFILDHLNLGNPADFKSQIVVTQPRRISALGLADRVAEERLDTTGNEIGYMIRGENRTSSVTRVTFVTTGILLRIIQGLLSGGDTSYFMNLKYIFVDEVHERSLESDLLLTILKGVMDKFLHLRIILMSATINLDIFNKFFGTAIGNVHIEGRTFPIEDYYLDEVLAETQFTITKNDNRYAEDDSDVGDADEAEHGKLIIQPKAHSPFFEKGNINYDLVASLCLKIDQNLGASEDSEGSILVFLPGVMEINRCMSKIEDMFRKNHAKCLVLPLHSALLPKDQRRVFKTPSAGVRKIVVTTNIAETSITIPDAVAVVDSGRVKNMYFDHSLKATKLVENWCSRAEAKQRRGRAGRVRKGICYKLYTRVTEQSRMIDQPVPEILRVGLENIYLIIKSMGVNNVDKFLRSGLDAPHETNIAKSRNLLVQIGALDHVSGRLSDLGRYLAMLPTDLHSGKLLILGTLFACLDNALTIAAITNIGNPFLTSMETRDLTKTTRMRHSGGSGSGSVSMEGDGDVVATMRVVHRYLALTDPGEKRDFIKHHHLLFLKMKDIVSTRQQYLLILKDVGFVPMDYGKQNNDKDLNKHKDHTRLLRSIVASAFYPQIARVQHPEAKFLQSQSGAVEIDPDAKATKFWVRNEAFTVEETLPKKKNTRKDDSPKKDDRELPANRAFIHPLSVFFNGDRLKADFSVYGLSHHTTKLFLLDITPVLALAVVFFGGVIEYDLDISSSKKTSPGLVVDGWLAIRTWCKNGVLLQRLRQMLDKAIAMELESPASNPDAHEVFSVIASIV